MDLRFLSHTPRDLSRVFFSVILLLVIAVFAELSWASPSSAAGNDQASAPATASASGAVISTASGTAQEQTSSSPTPTTQNGPFSTSATGTAPGPPVRPAENTVVDVVHAELSRNIKSTAVWMDSFFGDWRFDDVDQNASYIRLGYTVYMEKEAPLYRKPDIQIRIVLPQLRKKTKLVLTGTPRENRDFSAVNTAVQQDQVASGNNTRYRGPNTRNGFMSCSLAPARTMKFCCALSKKV